MRRIRWTQARKRKFLGSLRELGIVRYACEAAGCSPTTVYEARRDDPDFAALWAEAEEHAVQRLEHEAVRRAMYGTKRPVFQGGRRVGTITEYSDRLLEFLLSARSDRFRVRRLELTGANGGPVNVTDDDAIMGKLFPELAEERARDAIAKASAT